MRAALPILTCVLLACHHDPTCQEAVARLADRFSVKGGNDVEALIGSCEQREWPKDRRVCVAGAKTAEEVDACLPRAKEVKIPPPAPPEPSAATRHLFSQAKEPVRAVLFFPPNNEVAAQVEHYVKALGAIAIDHRDRLIDVQDAKRYKVTSDGALVIVRGELSETIFIGTETEMAWRGSGNLRQLDHHMQATLTRVAHDPPTVYLIAGHGEVNDPASIPAKTKITRQRPTTLLSRRLGDMGFRTKPLPATELAQDVPTDASVVLLLAPIVELAPAEWAALARYLDRGGNMLIALDPISSPSLGPLEAKLGVRFKPTLLCDDKQFLPYKKTDADHAFVATDQVSAHPATGMVARSKVPVILLESGVLESVPGAATTPTFIVRTASSAFVDLNANYRFDAESEHRDHWNVVAAVTLPKARVLVFADVDLFVDIAIQNGGAINFQMLGQGLLVDGMRWLQDPDQLIPEPASFPAPVESKERIAAELEQVERALEHALAAAITAPEDDRRRTATIVRNLQRDRDELRNPPAKAPRP